MKTKNLYPVFAALALAAALLSACVMVAPAPEPPVAGPDKLAHALGNLTYSGILPDQDVTLTDGRGTYPEEGPGTPYVALASQLIPTGDLNGDGDEDAAVLLTDYSSGSGQFTFLAAVLNATAAPTPTMALMIGDRIEVKSLAIENGEIVAEMIAQGGSDPACCPTTNVRKRYALQDGALVETGSEELGQVTLSDLDGTSWRLVDLGAGQPPLLPDSEITLDIAGGQVSGSAGCNRYTGALTSAPGELQSFGAGPLATTQMSCAEPVAKQETTYLDLLAQVKGWRYDDGYLALAYPNAESIYAYLRFAPQAQAAQPAPVADTGTATAGQGVLPRFEPRDECFVQAPAELPKDFSIDCGYVVVPEFRAGPSGRELKLGITRLSSGKGTAAAPLFMLAGGPGQAEVSPDFLRLFQPELLGRILEARDIVLVEQRGTEYTDTFLDCPVSHTAAWAAHEQGLTGPEADAFGMETIRRCIDDFKAQGVNFDAYNSLEDAADVNAVREALGYEKIIYYGASYGAQLGQHIMRDFPDVLEAVVLDGAEGLSRKSWVENRALDAQWGVDHLTALCQADDKCRAAFDIPTLVDSALALFDNGPLPYTYTDPADATVVVTGEVTVNDMVNLIYELQGDRIGAMSLPVTLAAFAEGGADAVVQTLGPIKGASLLGGRTAGASHMATLMHAAVVCSDDPVHSKSDVNLEGVGKYATLFGQAQAEQYVALCSLINVQELPDATDVNVESNVPALLLSGDLDVATPTFRSEEVAAALPNAQMIVFPGRTHVQIAAVNICAAQIMTQFVLDPTAKLDTNCTKESPVLGFVLPDGTSSRE